MKTKILSELKTKYKNLGLSDEILEGVANQLASSVKEETEIATAVTGAEQLLKATQKYADSRVNTLKTESEALKAKLKEQEGKGTSTSPGTTSTTEEEKVPAWAQTIVQKLDSLEGAKIHDTLSSKLSSILSEKKVPEKFYEASLFGRKFEKEEDVIALAETISNSFTEFQQSQANAQEGIAPEANQGRARTESEDLAKMINKNTQEIINNQKQ